MNTASELLERLQLDGAARFADTALATGHGGVTRRVRRDRAVRATVTSVASVAGVGILAVGVGHWASSAAPPVGTPAPAASSSPGISLAATLSVSVGKQERIEAIADDLAAEFGATRDEALAALTAALPPEAKGNPEGWVIAGDYGFDDSQDLSDAAVSMVSTAVTHLESAGVPKDQWLDTIILASIIQYEAPAGPSNQAGVARVLLNRLDAGMPLQIESPLAYFLRADEKPVGDDGWAVDTPYNTFMHQGLPPSAIGTPTMESFGAATDPADGDWLYFLRKDDGNVLLFSTFDEFAAAVDQLHPGTGASG